MAWASLGSIGSAQNKTGATTVVITTAAAAEVNNVVVVLIAVNNIQTTDVEDGTDIVSVVDSAGNTYVRAKTMTNGEGAAAAGATVGIYFSKVTTELPIGSTITITFNGSPAAKAVRAWEFSISAPNVVTVQGSAVAVGDAADPAEQTITGLVNREYLWLHALANEGPIEDVYTKDADYTEITEEGTTGGAAASNMTLNGEYRIFVGTTDTVDDAYPALRDHAQVYVALQEELSVSTRQVASAFGSRVIRAPGKVVNF